VLATEEEVEAFLKCQRNAIVVADQLNALTEPNGPRKEIEKRANLYWRLMRFTHSHKAVFSSSANYWDFLELAEEQTLSCAVRVYGGLEQVSHRKIS
jgi:hypothetical protein